jgi:hypothetical protein
MSCERHRETLAEAALGQPATAILAAHLAECAACRGRLEQLRIEVSSLDAALRDALAVEPPAGFERRTSGRLVEAEAAQSRLDWRWPLTAAAVGAAVLLLWLRPGPGEPPRASAPRTAQERNVARPAPSPPAVAARAPGSPRSPRAATRTAPREESAPVLVAAEERRGLALLAARLEDGTLTPSSLEARPAEAQPADLAIGELSMAPLSITPMWLTLSPLWRTE